MQQSNNVTLNTPNPNMDFHSVMETFAEAWVAANTHTPLIEAAEQGLINGPSNAPPTSHASVGQNSFTQPVLQESSNERHDAETSTDTAFLSRHSPMDTQHSSPLDAHHSSPVDTRHSSPVDTHTSSSIDAHQSSCSVIAELRPPLKNLSNPHGMNKSKCIPIHCIVEQIPGPQACGQYVELDSYAIIPGDSLFSELVRNSLMKLGYSDKQILGAKGAIQMKNWKPLSFDQITDNRLATLVDILGDLTTVATLHIRLYSVPDSLQEWTDTTVRNAVLELLREMSQVKLAKLCPLSQPMLSNIINNRYMGKIGKEKCQEFGKWYLNYRKQHPEGNTPEIVPCNKPVDGRLTFHPTKELPVMRDWFQSCRNPSRKTLQMYVDILNQGPVRQQERPKIAYVTLKNWWKNEKQRERKQKAEGGVSHENRKRRPRKTGPRQKQDIQRDEEIDGRLEVIEVAQLSEPRNLSISEKSSSTSTSLSFVNEPADMSMSRHSEHSLLNKADYVVLQVPERNKTPMILNSVPGHVQSPSGLFQRFPGHFAHASHMQKMFPSIPERFFMQAENPKEERRLCRQLKICGM